MKPRTLMTVAALAMATPAVAHHSGAMFDQTKLTEVKGTLIDYKFRAPHSWLAIRTAPDAQGRTQRWDVEGASAATMRRAGLTPEVIKPGLAMTLVIHPLRDGRTGGAMVSLTANGKTYSSDYTDNPYGTGRPDNDGGARVKER